MLRHLGQDWWQPLGGVCFNFWPGWRRGFRFFSQTRPAGPNSRHRNGIIVPPHPSPGLFAGWVVESENIAKKWTMGTHRPFFGLKTKTHLTNYQPNKAFQEVIG